MALQYVTQVDARGKYLGTLDTSTGRRIMLPIVVVRGAPSEALRMDASESASVSVNASEESSMMLEQASPARAAAAPAALTCTFCRSVQKHTNACGACGKPYCNPLCHVQRWELGIGTPCVQCCRKLVK